MKHELIAQIIKSYKYKNYENMSFLSSILYSNTSKYKLLLPISLYHTQEYSRALFFLSQMNTYTSTFYEYLCYKQIKEFKKALNCIKKILSDDTNEDVMDIDVFLIDKNDKEYFYNYMALLYTQLYNREEAIRLFKISYSIFPIFSTIENLIFENELLCIEEHKNSKENLTNERRTMCKTTNSGEYTAISRNIYTVNDTSIFDMQGYNRNISTDGSILNKTGVSSAVHDKSSILEESSTILEESASSNVLYDIIKDLIGGEYVIKKYKDLIPGIGSYILAFYAKKLFDMGMIDNSKRCFYYIRSRDSKFSYNMDYFSTVLWHESDITELGILCKNLIIDTPNSPITWKALGNFYNHKNDYRRSIQCLERSLYLCNDYYTLNLLGFESVYKNEYVEALEYFKKSILMLKNNYKSKYGCALVYDKMDKKESAEYYFKQCMYNNQLKVMGMKFYIKHSNMDQAIRIYKDGMRFDTIDINMLVKITLAHKGKYTSVEEFLILEFVEVLSKLNLLDFAKSVLNIVEYRGETYYKKRDLLYEKKHSLL